MWSEFRNKVIGGVAALAVAGGATIANQTGVWPVTQNQLMIEGWYQKRDRLLDRVEDGTITPYQRGILSGLCIALKIKQRECENRDNG